MNIQRIPLRMSLRKPLLLIVDSLLVNVAFISAFWLRQLPFMGETSVFPWSPWLFLITGLWIVSASLSGCYDIHAASDALVSINRVVGATSLLLGLGLAYRFLGGVANYRILPLSVALLFWMLSVLVLGAWRLSYAHFFEKPSRRVLVFGTGWAARELATLIEERPDSGYKLLGFLDDDWRRQGTLVTGIPILGPSANLASLVKDHRISEVIWAVGDDDTDKYAAVSRVARDLGVRPISVSLAYEQLTGRVLVNPSSGIWYGTPSPEQGSVASRFLKRGLDLTIGAIALVFLCPLLALIAVAVELDSPGPVLYVLDSLGKDGKRFRRFKFRTMRALVSNDEFKYAYVAEDPRVTRVGKFLRRMALDELPQLVNILRGEMSLVGPRADSSWFASEAESFVPLHELRRIVKPGLIGWAQVNYLSGKLLQDPLVETQYDFFYIKHQSPYLDLLIIFQAMVTAIVGPGRLENWVLQPNWNKALSMLADKDGAEFAQSAKTILLYFPLTFYWFTDGQFCQAVVR